MFSVCVAQYAVRKGGALRLQATASKQTRLLVKINGGADRVPEWLLSLKEGVHETRVEKHPPDYCQAERQRWNSGPARGSSDAR